MKIRTRLVVTYLVLNGLGFLGLTALILDDLWPRYMATMEEGMVETATLCARMLEPHASEVGIDPTPLAGLLGMGRSTAVPAQIYEVQIDRLDMRVYVTDAMGTVIYDSLGRATGADFSRWNDIARTLQGRYGARTTLSDPADPASSVLHVAAPVRHEGNIIGVVSVAKPARNALRFLYWARLRIILTAVFWALGLALLGAALYGWLSRPVERLQQYARAVRDGRREPLPALGRNEIGELGTALEEMRVALEGKEYISRYVQTLTHEMKSPIAAIRGAAELLEEDMPAEQRARFMANIRGEAERMQNLIDRLLQLVALEQRTGLEERAPVDLGDLVREVLRGLDIPRAQRAIDLRLHVDEGLHCLGEEFLLRLAVQNLLQNAIEFSPAGGTIEVELTAQEDRARLVIRDHGPGVPDYALPRIFERFYSLQRPDSGRKSSGLGLTIAREAVELHAGTLEVANHPDGGAAAVLTLPLHGTQEQ